MTMCFCFSDCKDEVILPGDIIGIITDAFTKQPLEGALVKINPPNYTTTTGNDGKYMFKSLNPGNYEIVVSKKAYLETSGTVKVTSKNISEYDFELNPIPVIHYSDSILNFSFNLTSLSFAITKTGTGKVDYIVTPSKNWITVDPKSGDIDTETDSIKATIDRTGLTEEKIQEWIAFTLTYENNIFRDTINISLKVFPEIIFNPDLSYGTVADIEGNIYKTIQIGNDTWMAENLKTTKYNDNKLIPLVMASNQWLNLATPAYCWPENGSIYWTSTESESPNYPWTWTINSQPLWRTNLFSKKYGLSVRCVKDLY